MPEIVATLRAPWQQAVDIGGVAFSAPWQEGQTVHSLGGSYTPPPAPPGGTPAVPSTAARFTIGSRPAYVLAHTVTAIDMRDGTALDFETLSVATSRTSMFWSLEATGGSALYAKLRAGDQPAAVRVTLDGQVWEFVVESVLRTRAHPGAQVRVSGRSLTCAAGAPYQFEKAWSLDGDTTAAQIAATANLYTGLEIVWSVLDWPIPAGVFTHSGTPLSVVRRVADAIEAVVQSDRAGYTVRVLPAYPLLPNEWPVVAPDVEISLDAIESESFENRDKPAYDGVYLFGQQEGAAAFVRLAGTTGANMHPPVTDALLTDDIANAQRGTAILGASGQQQDHTITVPVLTGSGEPGVCEVGWLARVVEPATETWYGLIRSVSVSWARPSLMQTLVIERHTALVGGTATSATPPLPAALKFTGPVADQVATPSAAFTLALAPFFSLGRPPYTYSRRSGTLPAWLALNETTGVVSGTAPGTGAAAVPSQFRATDQLGSTADTNVLGISVASPASPRILAASTGRTIWYSDDAGASWTSSGFTFPELVFIVKTPSGQWVAATNQNVSNNIYTSSDGVSWVQRTVASGSKIGVTESDSGVLAAGSLTPPSSVAYSNDAGVTWGTNPQTPPEPSGVTARRMLSWVHDRWFQTYNLSTTGRHSTDLSNWTDFTPTSAPATGGYVVIYFAGKFLLFPSAGGGQEYVETSNFSSFTTRSIGSGKGDSGITGPTFCAHSPTALVVPQFSTPGLLRTTDGLNWTRVSTAAILKVIYSGGVFYGSVFGFSTLYKSTDDGVTWTTLPTPPFTPSLIYGPQPFV